MYPSHQNSAPGQLLAASGFRQALVKGSLPASWPGHSDRGKSCVASFGMFWEVSEVSREKRTRRVF